VASVEMNEGIKDLLDIEDKLMELRKKKKNAELKKEDAKFELSRIQARAINAKPEEKQEVEKLIAEALAALQSAEDELAKATQSENDLTNEEKEKVENELKKIK